MHNLTKQKYFYYLVFMLMASTFLPVVFNNLPPLIRSHHIWTVIWGLSLLIFYPKVFLNKAIVYLFVYGLFLLIATETIWQSMDNWNYKSLFMELYEIAIGVSVIVYFRQSQDYQSLAKITRWTILFLFITAIMTIISSAIDPLYARNLIGISAITNTDEAESILSFKRYGGGSYSTASAFTCLLIILIYYYKNIRTSLISKSQIIIFSIIILLALFGMQIFANILIAICFSVIALMGMKKIKQSIIVVGLFLSVTTLIPKETYVNGLISISEYFKKDSELNYKFRDLAIFIETGADIKDNSTGTGGRVERYPMLMKTFVKSPLFGCYFFADKNGNGYQSEGGHLFWMNKLTITGIIGLLIFLAILYFQIKNNLQYFDSIYKFYYIIAALSIIIIGITKVIGGRDTWYTFFILLPGLYYLPLLKNRK